MRERIRLVLATLLYYTGIVHLAHWWQRRFSRSLIILNYHRATGDMLRQQMRYLCRYYRVLHLEEALVEFFEPGHKLPMDRRLPLVLTFDDGYTDNYTYGFQLARELHIPITIFLIPGYIESGERFWWLEGKRLAYHSHVEKVTIEGRTYRLSVREEQQALAKVIDTHVRHATSVKERQEFLATIRQELIPAGAEDSVEQVDRAALPLTWEQVQEMEMSGLVSFGAHTMHHPILSYLSNAQEMRQEIADSRRVLEERLGHPVYSFAYPVGKSDHIGDEAVRAVKETGYKWAVTTIEDVNTAQTDHYVLRRLPGDITLHWLVMASELVGLLGWSRWRRKKREGLSR